MDSLLRQNITGCSPAACTNSSGKCIGIQPTTFFWLCSFHWTIEVYGSVTTSKIFFKVASMAGYLLSNKLFIRSGLISWKGFIIWLQTPDGHFNLKLIIQKYPLAVKINLLFCQAKIEMSSFYQNRNVRF